MARSVEGIDKLRAKLQKLKNIDNDEIVMAVAERGAEIAKAKYGGKPVTVTTKNLGGGKAQIIASGNSVAFFEYGTGVEGEGTYEGQLPTEPISFESGGEQRQTMGWEYYYDNPDTKVTRNGQQGWLLNKAFVVGRKAEAQMWKTATELVDNEAANAIKNYLKEKGV